MDEINNRGRRVGRPRLPDPENAAPAPRKRAADLSEAELQAKRAYDRLATRRSRETRRRNRVAIDSSVGVDRLAVIHRLTEAGYSSRQINVMLPEIMRAEHERLRLERELRSERLAREQAENAVHNLRMSSHPAYAASQKGRR